MKLSRKPGPEHKGLCKPFQGTGLCLEGSVEPLKDIKQDGDGNKLTIHRKEKTSEYLINLQTIVVDIFCFCLDSTS